mmetsp:Transcript_67072/g.106647  ORF Transcript_67072/g.106647 Transcript_67072/m.106647 type:complete len:236 (+) Transcript_67072:23-730(+)|eukprot:CAMPEP_0197058070 /NCGR_PEP_ID=MMETSP1384-20130603/103637_1 /TAXON_ID=29189 /ORGANISM="Ammonia sp." /LENGTH=235 /DNA_ID=CAMNT_0042492693 /DNA_START=18 /DNA_END=725 /DNA_ORIENTATION=-
MAQQGQGNNRRKRGGRTRMAPKLAQKLAQVQQDAQTRQQQHAQNRGYQRENIGTIDRDTLEEKFTEKEYEAQLNDVSNLSQQQIEAALAYRQFTKDQQAANVSRFNRTDVQKFEQDALEYSKQQKEEEFLKLKKEEQIESLLEVEVKQIIGKSEWNKALIAQWMDAILSATGGLLDKYLKDGVYKYCIDVSVLKSTAIARQSDVLKSKTDYSFHMKIKNGFGVIVLINCHAFKIN